MLTSATGRLRASLVAEDASRPLVTAELERFAASTGLSRDALLERFQSRLAEVRERRMSRSEQEYHPGIDSLCGPVFGRDGMPAYAITLMGPHLSFDLSFEGGPDSGSFLCFLLEAPYQSRAELSGPIIRLIDRFRGRFPGGEF